MTENRNQAGVALGVLFGFMHALWVTAVGAGLGQPVINTLESWHFLSSNFSTIAFDPLTAISGIVGAGVTGYIIGWSFMYIYSFTDRKLD